MVPVGFEPTPTNVDSNLSRAETIDEKVATPTRFELVRAEPTHLAGERLNHSAKASLIEIAEGGFDPPTFGL